MTFVIFDLLRCDERDLTRQTYEERRHELVKLGLDGSTWTTCEAFEDGRALYAAVCELGYEGVVAKAQGSLYGLGEPGWVKIKNPGYWRRDAGIEGIQRSRERRRRVAWSKTI
jgi:bifunctional non-homologous end joining protein LigD